MTIETMKTISGRAVRRGLAMCALCVLAATLAVTWATASPAAAGVKPAATKAVKPEKKGEPDKDTEEQAAKTPKAAKAPKVLSGKLNLNAASEEQLMMLPGVGPAKAERIVAYRGKKGPFKRVADLRNVKGFGYKSLKKLEPYLDVKGDTTLAEQ